MSLFEGVGRNGGEDEILSIWIIPSRQNQLGNRPGFHLNWLGVFRVLPCGNPGVNQLTLNTFGGETHLTTTTDHIY